MDEEQVVDTETAATEAIAAWEAEHPKLTAGTESLREVLVAATADAQPAWGEDLPEGIAVAPDPAALFAAVRSGGYMTGALSDGLAGARALVIPDAGVIGPDQVEPITRFVRQGGTVVAFGHASLPPEGNDYALAEVFGVSYNGHVAFDTEASRVEVTADSVWAEQYSPEQVIDGTATNFWASIEGGPMPHWVQIAFGKPRTVARAEVMLRPGFLLQDFQIQCLVDDEWVVAAEVTDNAEWTVDCPFEEPITTSAVRCFCRRESNGGENRVIADVGEVTLFDEHDRRLIAPPYLIEGQIQDKALAKAYRSDRMTLKSPAVRITPEAVLTDPPRVAIMAYFEDPLKEGQVALCASNKLGKGSAYLFTVPEAALGFANEVWEPLLRLFVGMPSVRHSGDDSVVARLRRGKGRSVLHIVDTAPTEDAARAREVIVRLNTQALGPAKSVTLLPDGEKLETRASDGRVQFTAPMDPMASVLIRGKR